MSTEFVTEDCICPHLPYEHDDGFGCTVPGCLCLAQWSWATEEAHDAAAEAWQEATYGPFNTGPGGA